MLGPSQLIHKIIPLATHKHTESNVMCHIPIRTFFTVDTLFSLNYIYIILKKIIKYKLKSFCNFKYLVVQIQLWFGWWANFAICCECTSICFFFFWGQMGAIGHGMSWEVLGWVHEPGSHSHNPKCKRHDAQRFFGVKNVISLSFMNVLF